MFDPSRPQSGLAISGLPQRSQMPLTGKPAKPLASGMPDFCSRLIAAPPLTTC